VSSLTSKSSLSTLAVVSTGGNLGGTACVIGSTHGMERGGVYSAPESDAVGSWSSSVVAATIGTTTRASEGGDGRRLEESLPTGQPLAREATNSSNIGSSSMSRAYVTSGRIVRANGSGWAELLPLCVSTVPGGACGVPFDHPQRRLLLRR
jgi:hypothetical protein